MMIDLRNVTKSYGKDENIIYATDHADLTVEDGEFAVIIGHSGSGKTTLLNLCGGMTFPDEGEISIAGQDILKMKDKALSDFRANKIGFAFQFQSMLPVLTAIENVMFPLTFSKNKKDPELAVKLLDKVGMGDRKNAYSNELSAGQQRRVCMARALINDPVLLLCDEPTGDLDPENESVIMDIISEANKKGAAVLMTTHNHDLTSYGTRTIKIEKGKIIGNG